jgi:hypothetical protein
MKRIVLLTFLLSILFSCSKESENSDFFECRIDNVKYKSEGILAYAIDDGNQTSISVYGLENADTGTNPVTVYFVLDEISGSGNYELGDGQIGHGYYTNQTQSILFTTIPSNAGGTVSIDNINSERVSGSFSFTAEDDDGNIAEISAGDFDVSIR